jgi:methylmalonyl-CoA mutase cobalamin-binding subunit
MSTTIGNNVITGVTDDSGRAAIEAAEKQAKANAAAEAKQYTDADKALVSSLKAGEKAVQKIANALATAAELELHKHTVNAETGRPFASFTAYVQSRTAEFPLMHRLVRKEVVKVLTEQGHSVRAIAAAVQASPGSVVGDQQEAGLKEKTTPTTDADSDAQKLARIVKGAVSALVRIRDNVADFTDEELATLMAEITDTRSVVAATRKLRKEAADKAASKAAGKAAGKAKPTTATPASVAANGPQRAAVAVGA